MRGDECETRQKWWAGPNQATPVAMVRRLDFIPSVVGSITSRILIRGET